MKICNIINAKGKTVRLREDAEELTHSHLCKP